MAPLRHLIERESMKKAKRNQWLHPEKICIAQGNSVARNFMFENKQDHERFFLLWNRYLGKMTTIINYHLTPEGWTVLFRTHSEQDIRNAYKIQRKQSRKAKKKYELKDATKIISEHFRIFLSQYVRRLNASHGRKGTLVLERFRKYVIKDQVDYQKVFRLITSQKVESPQQSKKYQAKIKEYDITRKMEYDSILKRAKRIYMGLEKWDKILISMELIKPKSYVLRKYFSPHNPLIIPPPFT